MISKFTVGGQGGSSAIVGPLVQDERDSAEPLSTESALGGDLTSYKRAAIARFNRQGASHPLGRLWVWWKTFTWDPAKDEAVPEHLRRDLWWERQW